jgi:6-pyruvoyl tetrahydropterin synthase/QueD family protein
VFQPHWHGHNYEIDVTVEGAVDPSTGYVLDLKLLKEAVQEAVIDDVDHRNLNVEVPWLKGVNPTTENFVVAIWNRLENRIPPDVRLAGSSSGRPRGTTSNTPAEHGSGEAQDERNRIGDPGPRTREDPAIDAPGIGVTDLSQVPFPELVEGDDPRLGDDPDAGGASEDPRAGGEGTPFLTRGYALSAEETVGDALFGSPSQHGDREGHRDVFAVRASHAPFFGKVHVAYIPDGRSWASPRWPVWWRSSPADCRFRSD